MRIVIASSEAVPFSKTGGLADVASSLSKALAEAGHEVWLVTPYYPQELAKLGDRAPKLEPLNLTLPIAVGTHLVTAQVYKTMLPGSNVSTFLIDQPEYFDRPSLYVDRLGDYRDNCERFVFFSRSVIQLAEALHFEPDIIHANDWQTALIPALLQIEGGMRIGLGQTASVFTIHNLAFQGQFWHWDMLLTGLDWKYFNWRQMEFFGNLNLMKTGIIFSDMITTVSPTYAREIQTPEFGCGLNGVLSSRRDVLVGILNGVDTEDWNPAHDRYLPKTYDVHTVDVGKAACKAELQKRLGLPISADKAVFGLVSRLTGQKGLDLVMGSTHDLMRHDVQLVVLGTGEPGYEAGLQRLAQEFPEKIAVTIGYNEELAHLIEAGSDIFLMPSQYEPCGLNQMYSLMYGTVPIVRSVGGLADSVVDATEGNVANSTANGFSFHEYRSDVLFRQVCRALGLYLDRRTWRQLQRTGMERDWSWKRSAKDYVAAYQRAIQKRRHDR
ncbi:glycogen synthase GlgA [bacterium]|nr:glycogen synthase GlgA [bacterium]